MIQLLKRLKRCRIIIINCEEKPLVMRSELLQPREQYRRKMRLSRS